MCLLEWRLCVVLLVLLPDLCQDDVWLYNFALFAETENITGHYKDTRLYHMIGEIHCAYIALISLG